MVICLELVADLHMAQMMPLSLTVSCFSKIQIGFSFLVPTHLGSTGKGAVKRVCVCYNFTMNFHFLLLPISVLKMKTGQRTSDIISLVSQYCATLVSLARTEWLFH